MTACGIAALIGIIKLYFSEKENTKDEAASINIKAEVNVEKRFVEDLNADSLDLTELIMTFEEKFGLEIAEGEAEKLKTVGDVVTFINSKKA